MMRCICCFAVLVVNWPENLRLLYGEVHFVGQEGDFLCLEAFVMFLVVGCRAVRLLCKCTQAHCGHGK